MTSPENGTERVTEDVVDDVRYDPDSREDEWEATVMLHKAAHAKMYPIGSVKDTPKGRRIFERLMEEIEEIKAKGGMPWLPPDDLGPPSYEWPSNWRPR